MLPHPHLWPAVLGAALGLALIVWVSLWYVRRWRTLSPRTRWLAFAGIAALEALYWLNVYAWLIEPNLLIVRRVEIVSADWHGPPLTIAAIGDTHVASAHVDSARMGRIIRRVNGLRPDIVLLLGDYAGSHEPEAERSGREQSEVLGGIATFAGLNAPLGVVGVLGNHDSWYGRQTIARALEDAGVAALWNRNVIITRDGAPFVIAGLADEDTGDPDFALALDGAEGRDTIVISHSPDPFTRMPSGPALMLAAHSHCGQVTIPLVGRPILPIHNRRYACGLVEENSKRLYVTAGIGTSIVPVRFLNPPEIVLLTISPASGGSARA
ncbi:MAG: metallophosphoesterase [Hyphomonadaceae bacterium]